MDTKNQDKVTIINPSLAPIFLFVAGLKYPKNKPTTPRPAIGIK